MKEQAVRDYFKLNVLYYPYALIQLIKTSLFAGLDGAPLTNKFGKTIPDTNYLRIAAKGFIQSLFIIPEFLFFSLAKIQMMAEPEDEVYKVQP